MPCVIVKREFITFFIHFYFLQFFENLQNLLTLAIGQKIERLQRFDWAKFAMSFTTMYKDIVIVIFDTDVSLDKLLSDLFQNEGIELFFK